MANIRNQILSNGLTHSSSFFLFPVARVLVANPKVLILDEATSALDSESERVVQEALDKLLQEHKRTTIIIAHRLTTIRNADVIAVIADGKVAEKGTHEELMESEIGMYRNLVEKQEADPGSAPPSRTNSSQNLRGSMRESFVDAEIADGGTRTSLHVTHQLKFRNVTFSYPTRPGKLIMDGFNLSIRKGETLALVGPSGGGKSTTVSLVERFYDPNSGTVDFEGVDLKDLNVKWLRDQIGMVQQEPVLFNGSIFKNIGMGWDRAKQSDIIEAAKAANCHDFISGELRASECKTFFLV
jgi:ATP-binding cassette subfamily B (MDR/TAP) protein 1